MVLVDALNLKSYGGVWLLNHLIATLCHHEIRHFVLYNRSIRRKIVKAVEGDCVDTTLLFIRRQQILHYYCDKYSPRILFCFGNYGPVKELPKIRVITSFQNFLLLKQSDKRGYSILQKWSYMLKISYLRRTVPRSDYFIFPTEYVSKGFQESFQVSPGKCKVISFYNQQKIEAYLNQFILSGLKKDQSFIYVSSPSRYKNHKLLLDVWERLLMEGLVPTLKLTLPVRSRNSKLLLERISRMNESGAQIINLNEPGYIPYSKVLEETFRSAFVIFPSLNETFGFGLIEGAILQCKILVSNKEYVNDVVEPSLTFDPHDVEDILATVKIALSEETQESNLVMKDNIQTLVKFINSPT